MPLIDVFVPGVPQPKGSTKAYVRGGRAIVTSDNPKLRPWSATVTAAIAETNPDVMTGPVEVDLTFTFARPASHFGKRGLLPSAPLWPIGRPDIDKCERAILDALEDSGAIRNDGQVVALSSEKEYGDRPGVHLRAWDL